MTKLRLYFFLIFIFLAVPIAYLMYKTNSDLKRDSFLLHRRMAENLMLNIQNDMTETLRQEEKRPFSEYRYVHISDRQLPNQEVLNLSPLAAYPPESNIPGMIGYFQVDPDRTFHTPFLPDVKDSALADIPRKQERLNARKLMFDVITSGTFRPEQPAKMAGLIENYVDTTLQHQFLETSPATSASEPLLHPQIQGGSPKQLHIFDSNLKTVDWYNGRTARFLLNPDEAIKKVNISEKEKGSGLHSTLFAEVDPFQTKVYERKWLVFYRNVWWNERRYIQGFVTSVSDYFDFMIQKHFRTSALSDAMKCFVFYQGIPLDSATDHGEKPQLLFSSLAPYPFSDFQIHLAMDKIPPGSGALTMKIFSILLALTLGGGLFGLYRSAAREIQLSQQKSDFVSAVSHELRTPLTSIQMYGELLMDETVSDPMKRSTYLQYIRDESTRLTRLIENVLQLSRLERGDGKGMLVERNPVELIETIRGKLEEITRKSNFRLEVRVEGAPRNILANDDAMTQVLMNIVENAVKFSKDASDKTILLSITQTADHCVIRIRDFGPGVPENKIEKIFEKFYRIDSEMTRQTKGTGLGLALSQMLIKRMNATIEVANQKPGVEFSLRFDAID